MQVLVMSGDDDDMHGNALCYPQDGFGVTAVVGRRHVDDAAQAEEEGVFQLGNGCIDRIEQQIGILDANIHRFGDDVLVVQCQAQARPARSGQARS